MPVGGNLYSPYARLLGDFPTTVTPPDSNVQILNLMLINLFIIVFILLVIHNLCGKIIK